MRSSGNTGKRARRWTLGGVAYGAVVLALVALGRYGVDFGLFSSSGKELPALAEIPQMPEQPRPGDLYTDALGLGFRWVPGGTYTLGSPESEAERQDSDLSPHEVESEGFWMAETETTQAIWQAQGLENPSLGKHCPDCPVDSVNWYEVVAFANLLSQRTGLQPCWELLHSGNMGEEGFISSEAAPVPGCTGYRLPTEEEWEIAARAQEPGEPYRERYGQLEAIAWYHENSGIKAHRVGTKLPNAWKLYDMLGNLYEWTSTATLLRRTVRSGCYSEPSQGIRAASRYRVGTELRVRALGFRLVLPGLRHLA